MFTKVFKVAIVECSRADTGGGGEAPWAVSSQLTFKQKRKGDPLQGVNGDEVDPALPDHPWPCLSSMVELTELKKTNYPYHFKCVLCLLGAHFIMTY